MAAAGVEAAGAGVLAAGVGVESAGVDACVIVLVTVGVGFAAGAGFTVAALVGVDFGAGP